MQQTSNLKLKKPDTGDPVKISDLNENADILDTQVAGKLDKSGGTLTGPIMLADGDGKGINLPSNGTINGPGTATLFGFLSGNFTVGSTVWPTNIRGMSTKPTYNGASMALMSDIPDISGLATSQALTDGLAGKQDTGNYLEVSAEDYVENAHVWFRNTVWAKNLQCDSFSTTNNISAGWFQSKSVADLNAVPNLYPVFRDDKWIYSRTRAEMISDLGIDTKANASELSNYALKTELPDITPLATTEALNTVSSKVDGIAPTVAFDTSTKVLTVTVNGKSDTATIDAGGGDIEVITHW